MKIQISLSTKILLDNIGGFHIVERGPVTVKVCVAINKVLQYVQRKGSEMKQRLAWNSGEQRVS